jgi:serine/threonine-protein kinase
VRGHNIPAITDAFVLPFGSKIRAANELPEQVRIDIGSEEGDFVLSRPNSRTLSKVIEAEAAELIRAFEEPNTIALAVARFSRRKNRSPEQVLEDALPLFLSLIREGLLVSADSEAASEIAPSIANDDSVDAWTVLRCVQMMEDSEIYLARDPAGRLAALKLSRPFLEGVSRAIEREASILSRLDGKVTPKLLGSGTFNSRAYLLAEWFSGRDAQSVCGELRYRSRGESWSELLQVTCAVLDAYAHLHEQGVIHADVHPHNSLIDRHNAVKIIDLGLAHEVAGAPEDRTPMRGGVGFFFEPEYARAARNNEPPPPPTLAGEQYSLAVLLYLLITGSHYLDFSLEKHEMFRQIAQEPMVPFSARGIDPWPDVEQLLSKALSKEPSERFASVADFARAWSAVEEPKVSSGAPASDSQLAQLPSDVIRMSSMRSPLMNDAPMAPPFSSVNYGSAGLACALYRIACVSDDAELLALADLWSVKSLTESGQEGAYHSNDLGITAENVGTSTLYHGPAGAAVVQALIAHARGDSASQYSAVRSFLAIARQPCEIFDLTLGRTGALLGGALLLDTFDRASASQEASGARGDLIELGRKIHAELWGAVAGHAVVGQSQELTLGIAHGWAGLLYASMCWCSASGDAVADSLRSRLNELANCAEPIGRGVQWKWKEADHSTGYMPGWCNGSAGFVFLWILAYGTTSDLRYRELAEGAAWHVWETPTPNASLCCGAAGQAYALLAFYRLSHDSRWLERAADVAEFAAAQALQHDELTITREPGAYPHSLFKGTLGLAVLAADLKRPDDARMPMFERER